MRRAVFVRSFVFLNLKTYISVMFFSWGSKIYLHLTGRDFVQSRIPSPRQSATHRRVPISSTGISRRLGRRTGDTQRRITAQLPTGTDTDPMGGVQGTAAAAVTAIAAVAEAGMVTGAEIATGSGRGIAASSGRTRGCPERSTMRCRISADTRRDAGSPGMPKGRDGATRSGAARNTSRT